MKSKKNLITIALIVVISLIGLSYAFFNYYQLSNRNLKLITGQVYLRLNEGVDQINLTNAFPETVEEARSRDDNYITFTITGKNTTTNNNIYYEIDLANGVEVEGRTRLNPSDLRFDLIEIIDGKEIYVVNNESFADFNDKKIWIDQIDQNTTETIEKNYKLRMWISEDVHISDTAPNASYTTGEYANSYASVKVLVQGDFNERTTDPACFETEDILDNMAHRYITYDLKTDEASVNACKTYFNDGMGGDISDAQDGYQSFCEGTGTVNGMTLDQFIRWLGATSTYGGISGSQTIDDLVAAGFIANYQIYYEYYSLNTNEEAIQSCVEYLPNIIPNEETSIYESVCSDPEMFKLMYENFDSIFTDIVCEDLKTKNVFLVDDGPIVSSTNIIGYDASCGTEVFIPATIDGKKVKMLDDLSFKKMDLTKVIISKGIEEIGMEAFSGNKISNIVIPGTIKRIGSSAFVSNKMENVYFQKGIKEIGYQAFWNNSLEEVDIPTSVTTLGQGCFNRNYFSQEDAYIYNRLDANSDGIAEIDTTTIVSYAGKEKNVTIPEGVTTIGNYSFYRVDLESVVIPEGVILINDYAFSWNELKEINIPNSVTTISREAFSNNDLEKVTIGSGIQYIGFWPFDKGTSNTLSITINKTCEEIKAIPASSTNSTIYYPWVNYSSPYTDKGVTIYDINGNVCDSY